MNSEAGCVPVSVVIPCYACAATIERALASVLAQTKMPAEVIMIDDASPDDSLEKLSELASAYPGWVKLLRLETNQGVASARNAGWAMATQPYIAFLDADDAWHPEKLAIQYTHMSAIHDLVLCGHGHRVLQQAGIKPDWGLGNLRAKPIHKWSLLLRNQFITPSVMVRREIPHRFAEGRRFMEDRLLWLEVVCSGDRVELLNLELAATYKLPYGARGLSSNLWEMTKADVSNYRILQDRGHLSAAVSLVFQLFSLLKLARRLAKVAVWRLWSWLIGK